jgi:hypothetical protein
MADRSRKWVRMLAGAAAWAVPCLAVAGDSAPTAAHALAEFMTGARAILQDGTSRLESMLQSRFQAIPSDKPDWLREQSLSGLDDDAQSTVDSLQLVVQQDRRDGTDLLTLRYPIAAIGDLRAYAGAGLNQTEYYASDSGSLEPDVISRRMRHRSMGGAAELGAELRLSEQVHVNADVRWVELASDASLLRASDGLVSADPVSVGISLGWRFR